VTTIPAQEVEPSLLPFAVCVAVDAGAFADEIVTGVIVASSAAAVVFAAVMVVKGGGGWSSSLCSTRMASRLAATNFLT
jgi:hypothetical protein